MVVAVNISGFLVSGLYNNSIHMYVYIHNETDYTVLTLLQYVAIWVILKIMQITYVGTIV